MTSLDVDKKSAAYKDCMEKVCKALNIPVHNRKATGKVPCTTANVVAAYRSIKGKRLKPRGQLKTNLLCRVATKVFADPLPRADRWADPSALATRLDKLDVKGYKGRAINEMKDRLIPGIFYDDCDIADYNYTIRNPLDQVFYTSRTHTTGPATTVEAALEQENMTDVAACQVEVGGHSDGYTHSPLALIEGVSNIEGLEAAQPKESSQPRSSSPSIYRLYKRRLGGSLEEMVEEDDDDEALAADVVLYPPRDHVVPIQQQNEVQQQHHRVISALDAVNQRRSRLTASNVVADYNTATTGTAIKVAVDIVAPSHPPSLVPRKALALEAGDMETDEDKVGVDTIGPGVTCGAGWAASDVTNSGGRVDPLGSQQIRGVCGPIRSGASRPVLHPYANTTRTGVGLAFSTIQSSTSHPQGALYDALGNHISSKSAYRCPMKK